MKGYHQKKFNIETIKYDLYSTKLFSSILDRHASIRTKKVAEIKGSIIKKLSKPIINKLKTRNKFWKFTEKFLAYKKAKNTAVVSTSLPKGCILKEWKRKDFLTICQFRIHLILF